MPDLFMDVDIALSEVPVNILALTDDTDFKTRETGIVYNQAGMDLVWNFITTAGVYTQTAVTPTTEGDYDWSHQGDGMYSIEITASGGASINNDTEGVGWFTGICTGVLPWRGPTIGFRAAGINNLLIDSAYSATRGLAGTALPAAAADAAGGLPISDAGGLALDTQLANTHEVTAARMGALTDWINGGRLDLILDIIAADVVNIDGSPMIGTNNAALAATALSTVEWTAARAAYLDELAAANIPADIADIPTVAEFNARTIPAANYFDPAADTVVNVTNCAVNADMVGTDNANTVVPDAAGVAATPAEVAQALANIHLDHLLAVDYDPASKPGVATALLNELVESDGGVSRFTENALEQAPSGTGGDATAANQTLIYNRIGAPAGADIAADIATRSSHTAADIWAVGARTLTSFGTLVADIWNTLTSALTTVGSIGKLLVDNINATISSRSILSTSDVKNEADDALSDIHLDHLLAVDYDPASKPGVATALLNELVESDSGVSRFTENALEQAPSGTGGDATEAKQDTIITHLTEVKGAGFIESTDSLEAIIDTGNANWGGSAASYVGAQGGQLLNFRVNEKSGLVIYDKIHSDYKGILEDGVTFEEGVKGKALTFDGTGSVECQQNFDETRYSDNPVISLLTGPGGAYAPYGLYDPSILFVGDEMWIYYSAVGGGVDDYVREGLSISKDGGLTFEAYGMVLDVGAVGEWDDWKAHDVDVLYDDTDSTYKMWYTGNKGPAGGGKIGLATSPDGKVWTKYAGNPVFDVDVPGTWDDGGVSYPSVLEEGGTFYMFYGGYDDTQHNGMGLATSPDGITWTRAQSTPVIPLTNYMKYTVTEKNGVYYVIFAKRFSYQELYMGYSTDKINWIINWHQVMRIGESSEWDDGAIEDADFYFDGTDAKIYYSGARTKSVDNQIGLITIENLETKVQKAEILNQYPISICCWIKTTDATSPVGIIKKGLQSTPDIWNVYMFEGRLRAFYVPNNSNNIQMITVSDDGGIINDGLWHHIIFIVDASGGELFVDLVSKNTKAWTGTPEATTSTEFMLIGEYDVTYSTIITGSIDDIRIYDHALSSDERRGIYMGVPYLEDNTLENIREQETIGNSIDETKGVNFNTDTDSLKAIVDTGNADWITGDGLSGSNAITINIKDQNADNVVACAVEIWDQANTVFYERKSTNSNGDTSYSIDDGTYTVRIHKAGYIFSDKTLIVTDAEIVNYTGTTVIIGTPAAADACRVYDFAFQSDGLTPVETIDASCFISALPYDYSGKIHSGERRDAIYDTETGKLYWDLARGSTVKFRVKHFGYMNKTKTIPDSDQARLTDL